MEREESKRRNCHCHRRRMIVLARKAGILNTKDTAQRRERERTITFLYLCDITLPPPPFSKRLSGEKLLGQSGPTDGAP